MLLPLRNSKKMLFDEDGLQSEDLHQADNEGTGEPMKMKCVF